MILQFDYDEVVRKRKAQYFKKFCGNRETKHKKTKAFTGVIHTRFNNYFFSLYSKKRNN